jgi:hypothetical protein
MNVKTGHMLRGEEADRRHLLFITGGIGCQVPNLEGNHFRSGLTFPVDVPHGGAYT